MSVSHYTLNSLEEIYPLSVTLAQFFPDPVNVQLGIYELLLNALEHGNLGIDQDTKTRLLREYRWQEEVTHRLGMPQHRSKLVRVTLDAGDTDCRVTITDQGDGFDWRSYMTPGERSHVRLHGLGLLMARHAGFDAIEFNELGNEVSCVVRKNQETGAA